MRFSSVGFNMKDRLMTIWLPATKTDPRALTCQRSWGCTCLGTDGDWLCPFHAGWDQHEQVKEHFGRGGVVPADVPFFPSRDGKALSMKQVVEAVNCTASAAGLELRAADGSLIFTGHVFRITGPRHLARHHVPVPVIKMLARWQSDTVLRYIVDVPLECLTADYKDRIADGMIGPRSSQEHAPNKTITQNRISGEVVKKLEALAAEWKDVQDKQDRMLQRIEAAEYKAAAIAEGKINDYGSTVKLANLDYIFVVSDGGRGCYHRVVRAEVPDVGEWHTKCGWPFGHSNVESKRKMPRGLRWERICGRCFPEEEAHRYSLREGRMIESESDSAS